MIAHPSPPPKDCRTAITPRVLIVAACGFVVSFFSPALRLVYASVLGLYVSVVVAVSLLVAARSGNVKILPWLPVVFATVHAGAGFGVLAEVVAGKPMKNCGCEQNTN